MSDPWRLVVHPPRPGDWNMAADEVLLEGAGGGAPPCLRLYGWDRPTLSLGYFQSLDDIPPDARDRWALVRRPTGGGAILHDRELTYAVAVGGEDADGATLYRRVNQALLAALASMGIEASEAADQPRGRAQRGPFFCFARTAATDIIARSRKLAGGAQRRRRGAVLQHGSVLLETDEPAAIGASEMLGRSVKFAELARHVVRGFEAEFCAPFDPSAFSTDEERRVEAIRRRRYGSAAWLSRGNRRERV